MQGYVPAQDEAFAESRRCFGELEDWMASAEAAGLQHGELEEQLEVRGRELLRRLFQDRLDLTAALEERRHDVAGEDGVVRTRATPSSPATSCRRSSSAAVRSSRS